jgi:hypothetical protein
MRCNAKDTASRFLAALMTLTLVCAGFGCDDDDADARPWELDDGADAGVNADGGAYPDVPGVHDDANRDQDRPEFFVGCQDETDVHRPEVKLRGSPRIEDGLDLNWSYVLPLPGQFGATEDVERVSAPSLSAHPNNRFSPYASFSSESRSDEMYNVQDWGVATFTGAEVGGGSSGSSVERFRSISPNPVIPALDSSAQIVGEYYAFNDRIGVDVHWESDSASASTGMPMPVPNPERTIGRFGMFPGGLYLLHWGARSVVGINPAYFDAPPDESRRRRLVRWSAHADYLWGAGASSPTVEWIAGPRPGEAVVLLDAGDMGKKWVRLDRCGEARDLYAAADLARDILWTGQGYIVLLEDEQLPGGARPLHIAEDGTVRGASFGCRHLVERQQDRWACLRQTQTGFTAVTFGPDMKRLDEKPLPGTGWSTARLDLAGDGGALVFTGLGVGDDGTRQFQIGMLSEGFSGTLQIPPETGAQPTPEVLRDRIGVLGPSGVFVFTTEHAVYGVETPIPGLANTRHPRTLYAGNESRGFVSVE